MLNIIKSIGIVDWYKIDRGYGVLKKLPDQKEYFIHHSEISSEYKYLLSAGDLVIFSPVYDKFIILKNLQMLNGQLMNGLMKIIYKIHT